MAELAARQREGDAAVKASAGSWPSAARTPRLAGPARHHLQGIDPRIGRHARARERRARPRQRDSVRHALVAGPGRPVRDEDVINCWVGEVADMGASLKCLSWSAAERYASAARTVVHLIVGPARDERCVVLSPSCGARLWPGYPQRYCTLRMPVARPGWRYRRPGKSRAARDPHRPTAQGPSCRLPRQRHAVANEFKCRRLDVVTAERTGASPGTDLLGRSRLCGAGHNCPQRHLIMAGRSG